MTTQEPQQQLDLRPFELFVPVPPQLAEAVGYTGQVFGHPLDARWVALHWERGGDEVVHDDGRASGTGEYSGYLAFVEHPMVAVHLRRYDFGSSDTSPHHYLLLDRTENRLYALPVQFARQFLVSQWQPQKQEVERQSPEGGEPLPISSLEELIASLNRDTWQEVTPPADLQARVMSAMQHQDQLVGDLVAWLNSQRKPLSPEQIAKYEPHAPAMLLRHAFGGTAEAFAQAGELVHIHEVRVDGSQVELSFYRDNGVDGPDTSHLFSVHGPWEKIATVLEPLIETGPLDDLLESGADLTSLFGKYAAWNGQAFPIVPMLDTLAIRVFLPCAKCGKNPMIAFARSGCHRGAFCYVYDAFGTSKADLRNQEYVCPACNTRRAEADEHEREDF